MDLKIYLHRCLDKTSRDSVQKHVLISALVLKTVYAGGKRVIGVQTPQGTSNVEIEIPRGIVHGESVRFAKAAPGGIDLVVNFRIQADPKWQRNGLDMHTDAEC